MTCAHCQEPMTGRKRTYCTEQCQLLAKAERRRSRGPRKPDKPVAVECAVCGLTVMRMPRPTKHGRTCSTQCRKILTFGIGTTCQLPADHMARNVGQSCRWTAPVVPRPVRVVACEWCGQNKETKRLSTTYCSPGCGIRAGKARRRAAEHMAPGTYTWAQIVALWQSFGRACAYCATPTPLDQIQAEHVHPLSRGGRNDLGNLLPACHACNSDKRDLLLPQWNPDRQRRGLPPVRTAWDDHDPRYTHLTTPNQALPEAA